MKSSKIRAALNPRRERGPDLIPDVPPNVPPEVGADITPANCDLSETQCIAIPELFRLLLLELTTFSRSSCRIQSTCFFRARNCRMANVIAASDLCQRLPGLSSR